MVIIFIIVSAFCLPVFASTPAVSSYKTTSRTVSPITFKVSALQMDAQDGLDNGSAYDYEIYIGASVTNSISTACYIDDLSFTLNFGDSSSTALYTLVDIETYSPDLSLSCVNHTFGIVPSNEFSWSNGLVVPAHSSLYLVAKVRVRWTGPSSSTNNLNSITAYNFTTTTSDVYVPGTPVDFSPIIDYIDSLPTQTDVNNILTILSQFYLRNHDELQSIINALGQTLNYNSNYTSVYSNAESTVYSYSNYAYVNRYVQSSVNEVDLNTHATLNNIEYDRVVDYAFTITYLFVNSTNVGFDVRWFYNQTFSITNNTNMSVIGIYFDDVETNDEWMIRRLNNISFYLENYRRDGHQSRFPLYPRSMSYIRTKIHVLLAKNTNQTINDTLSPTITWGDFPDAEFTVNESYTDKRLDSIDIGNRTNLLLKQLLDAYASVNNIDDISNASGSVTTKESQVHTQEQSYFTQNSQAIQATGLSNYRFDTVQQNGINAVSVDFTQLWNALGAWNSVYIFSLTLTLSLTILRHAPNAISRKQRKKQE